MISLLAIAKLKQIQLKNGTTVMVGDKLSYGIIPDLEIIKISDTEVEVYSCYTTGKYLISIDKFRLFNYKKIE
jgi:hypothetical protein